VFYSKYRVFKFFIKFLKIVKIGLVGCQIIREFYHNVKKMFEVDTGCSTQNTGCSKISIFYNISQNYLNWVSKVSNHQTILPECQKI